MTNESDDLEAGSGTPAPAAIAATENPVQLTVGLVEDDRIPEGMICMGSYRNGRLIARSVMPPEAWDQITQYGIFDEPVQVVLVARAAPPGLQCQLYAMVPLPEEEDEHRGRTGLLGGVQGTEEPAGADDGADAREEQADDADVPAEVGLTVRRGPAGRMGGRGGRH